MIYCENYRGIFGTYLLTTIKNAEIALSARTYSISANRPKIKKRKIKVLAILGNSDGINIGEDKKILKQHFPDDRIEFLLEPSRAEFYEKN